MRLRPPEDESRDAAADVVARETSVDDIEGTAGIMLVERETLVQRIPSILDDLADEDRHRLMAIGQQLAFEPEQPLFRQGDPNKGIYLINSGRIRSYYAAPSGREVTLAYWFPGNFVGAPDMFGGGTHMWGSSAVQRTSTIFLPGPELRRLALASAPIAVALLDALVVQGALLFGHGADARHALGDRTPRAPAGVPGDRLRIEGARRHRDRRLVHPRRSREPHRLDPAMGHGAARAAAGARDHTLQPRTPRHPRAGRRWD